MKHWLVPASMMSLLLISSACVAAGPAPSPAPLSSRPPARSSSASSSPQTASPTAAPAPQGPPQVCLDAQTTDKLTQEFAERLKETIAASGTLSLASSADTCRLLLHVPGNLLRFETAGSIMVSTVVIVTSSSGQYLSTSITACPARDLRPCAVRAVAAAKLAVLVRPDSGGT